MANILQTTVSRSSPDLVIAGTKTSAGKNLLACGLLRLAKQRHVAIKPLKPLEIDNFVPVKTPLQPGTYLQARAAGVTVEACMNPIRMVYSWGQSFAEPTLHLLGEAHRTGFDSLLSETSVADVMTAAVGRLKRDGARLLIEVPGAFDESQAAPAIKSLLTTLRPDILLIGDFLRGGGLASLIGTLELTPPELRRRVVGVVLNHLDLSQGEDLPKRCSQELQNRYGIGVVGILPTWTEGFNTISEDEQDLPDLNVFDAQVDRLAGEIVARFAPEFLTELYA